MEPITSRSSHVGGSLLSPTFLILSSFLSHASVANQLIGVSIVCQRSKEKQIHYLLCKKLSLCQNPADVFLTRKTHVWSTNTPISQSWIKKWTGDSSSGTLNGMKIISSISRPSNPGRTEICLYRFLQVRSHNPILMKFFFLWKWKVYSLPRWRKATHFVSTWKHLWEANRIFPSEFHHIQSKWCCRFVQWYYIQSRKQEDLQKHEIHRERHIRLEACK